MTTLRTIVLENGFITRGSTNVNRIVGVESLTKLLVNMKLIPKNQDTAQISTWLRAIQLENSNFQVSELFFHPESKVDVVGVNKVTGKEECFKYPDREDPLAKAYPWSEWGIE